MKKVFGYTDEVKVQRIGRDKVNVSKEHPDIQVRSKFMTRS